MARLAKDAVSSDDDSTSSSSVSVKRHRSKTADKAKSHKRTKKESHTKAKHESSSEDEEMKSGSESDSESESESRSSSETESSSSSVSAESDDSSSEVDVVRNDHIQKAIDAKNAQSGAAVQAKPYKAPGSFRKVLTPTPLPSEISAVFADTGNKQVWHITAPASVPVSTISTLALDAVATGQPVLSHKGAQYRLREEQLGADTTKHLLLPDASGTTYKKHPLRVVQTFHLEQVVDAIVPQTTETAPSKGLVDKYRKPVRQQPKNLKARNTPMGVTEEEED